MPESRKACFFRDLIQCQDHTRLVDIKTTNRTKSGQRAREAAYCCLVRAADRRVAASQLISSSRFFLSFLSLDHPFTFN